MTITEIPAGLIRSDGASSSATTQLVLVEDGSVTIPDAAALLSGTFAKVGSDLLIVSPSGAQYLVQDFFLIDPPPFLTDGEGLVVSGAVVARLAEGQMPVQVAQEGEVDPTQAIGLVQTVEGEITVERADGTIVVLSVGDACLYGRPHPHR